MYRIKLAEDVRAMIAKNKATKIRAKTGLEADVLVCTVDFWD
jgi:hypothetical protein